MTSAILNEVYEQTFFTGSAFVGRIVAQAAAKNLRPCVLELGEHPNSVILVLADIKIHKIWCWVYIKFIHFGVDVTVDVRYFILAPFLVSINE